MWSVASKIDQDTGRVYLDAAELVSVFRDRAVKAETLARSDAEQPEPHRVAQLCLAQLLTQTADDIDVGCLDYVRERGLTPGA